MQLKNLCFCKQFSLEKAPDSNILLRNQNCFQEQVPHMQRLFTVTKNSYFDPQTLMHNMYLTNVPIESELSRFSSFKT